MFAVLDVETTALCSGRHDRIVEIAVVRIDDACRPVDEWVTLVNPERDLGPTSIHGITGRHVADAPTFAEVAGDVLARLADAVVVGHNVRFDLTFVWAEFTRVGYQLPPSDGLCTLDLSARLGHTLHFTGDSEKAWDRPRGASAFADHLPTKLSAEGLLSRGAGG